MIWANSGALIWNKVKFKETASVKFDECLFLTKGDISFNEARFPKDGNLMFQRCYFARTPRIDFTGAFFRHTTFEGGKISWLEKQQDRTLTAILEKRLGRKFEDLPQEAKNRIEKLDNRIPKFSRVFEKDKDMKVLWKDLTTESAKNLTFRRTNLSHSLFDGMTLSHIQLNAPEWVVKDGRNVLYEDLQSKGEERTADQLRNIEDQYTQLKNNLERQGNYLHAGDFHYGEQEIRRERLIKEKGFYTDIPNIFKYLLATFYKAVSGYGERPERAVLATLVMLLIFPIVLTAIKIDYVSQWPVVSQAIVESDYLAVPLKLWEMVKINSPEYFKIMVQLITPFSWRKGPLEDYHIFLIPFQLFLLGIQLPLLILAIRRRFKR